MNASLGFLTDLSQLARQRRHRFVVQLQGDTQWQLNLLQDFIRQEKLTRVLKVGGKAIQGADTHGYKSGQKFLGMEFDCLIYDDGDGFDANSLTAASGSLVGGGLLFLLWSGENSNLDKWLANSLMRFQQQGNSFLLAQHEPVPLLPLDKKYDSEKAPFADQQHAIQAIKKVVSGHRKRPLVMTADRGRGKSAALGLASAQLMHERRIRILVTAPARKAVEPLFAHAKANLSGLISQSGNEVRTEQSSLTFISPDELLKQWPECDFLIVDEASAIPIPLLKKMVGRYHRMAFSTTVHGYEGCGRGFTLKFTSWLDENRPGWHSTHLAQPIRWQEGDPVEQWLFDTFLLDAELGAYPDKVSLSELNFVYIDKSALLDSDVLYDCFALLVNAHYQTTPNDLVYILDDPSVHLFVAQNQEGKSIGCVLVNQEGALDAQLVEQITRGERRPKGELVAGAIACQLGYPEGALQSCLRIMRIAVHPGGQGRKVGSWMLTQLRIQKQIPFDYIATSFGVTADLLQFWLNNGFSPLRLGASRDQASGTHSLLMIDRQGGTGWVEECYAEFGACFAALLKETFSTLEPELVVNLLAMSTPYPTALNKRQLKLVEQYCKGSCLFESVYPYAYELALCLLRNSRSEVNKHDVLVVVAKVLQSRPWSEVAELFELSGRKQAEQQLRNELSQLLEFTL